MDAFLWFGAQSLLCARKIDNSLASTGAHLAEKATRHSQLLRFLHTTQFALDAVPAASANKQSRKC